MPYGQEHAVILPSDKYTPYETFMQLSQRQELRQLREQQRADRFAQQQMQMAKYLQDQTDYSQYATGIPYNDMAIHQGLDLIRQQYADKIKRGDTGAELIYGLGDAVSQINKYSVNTKHTRKYIDDALKEFEKMEGFNIDAIRKDAYRNAFTQYDPNTGTFVLRNPDEIAPIDIRSMLFMNPEYSTGAEGLIAAMNKKQKNTLDLTVGDDYRGVKTKRRINTVLLPHQLVEFNPDGTPRRKVFESREAISPDGKSMRVLDDAAYQEYFLSDDSSLLFLEREFRRRFPKIDPFSDDAEVLRRGVALEVLNDYGDRGGTIRTLSDRNVDAPRRGGGGGGGGGGKKRPYSVFDDMADYVKGLTNHGILDESTGLLNITQFVKGGGGLRSAKMKKKEGSTMSSESYYSLFYNPDTKSFFVQDEEDSAPEEIPLSKLKDFMVKHAQLNGLTTQQAEQVYNEMINAAPELNEEVVKAKESEPFIEVNMKRNIVKKFEQTGNDWELAGLEGRTIFIKNPKGDNPKTIGVKIDSIVAIQGAYYIQYKIDGVPVKRHSLSKKQLLDVLKASNDYEENKLLKALK